MIKRWWYIRMARAVLRAFPERVAEWHGLFGDDSTPDATKVRMIAYVARQSPGKAIALKDMYLLAKRGR